MTVRRPRWAITPAIAALLLALAACGGPTATPTPTPTEATAPEPPTGLIASVGDAQATVTFTSGADGGSPLTNHAYTLDDGATWTALDPVDAQSPVTIAGLRNEVTQTLRLRAVNAVGVSAPSAGVSVRPRSETLNLTIVVTEDDVAAGTNTLELPLRGVYAVSVDWGERFASPLLTPAASTTASHTYEAAGTYHVRIQGELEWFGGTAAYPGAALLRRVDAWGDLGLSSLAGAFYGAKNLMAVPADLPPAVSSTSRMFLNASSFDGDVGGWDVGSVTDMSAMFFGATAFQGDIGEWDVGNVTSMGSMFWGATAFRGGIGGWNVGNVTNMASMFAGATAFEGGIGGWDLGEVRSTVRMFDGATSFTDDLGEWDVADVTDMMGMFQGATAFDGDVGGWDVRNVAFMLHMFEGATAFNGDISGWDVAKLSGMRYMFSGATAFDQDLGGWDISRVSNMDGLFSGSGLSTTNYDATLIGWATRTPQTFVRLQAGSVKHSAAATAARDLLIGTYAWQIEDGGLAP